MMQAAAILAAVTLLLTVWAPNVAANTRVNQDQPPPAVIQHSPSIAIDYPTDRLVVGYTEDPFGANGIGVSYRTHSNPASAWADATITAPTTGYYGIEEDVSVVSDGMGYVYACYVSYDALAPGNTNSAVYVARSNDGGATFPVTAQAALQSGMANSTPFIIQPKIEADEFPASPYNGQVYTMWEEDQPGNPFWQFSDVNFSASGFGGQAWSAAQTINDNQGGDLALWPDGAVAPNGNYHCAWLDTPYWFNHQGTIYADRSTDGGVSFGSDVPAVTFWAVPQMLTDTAGQATYAAMSYPSIEVDESNSSHVCAVYAADPDDGPAVETRLDVGDFPAGTADAATLHPFSGATTMSCSNGYVYTVWVDYRTSPESVHFNRSTTGIAPWAGPEIMLSSQPANQRMGSKNANIASDGNNVYVVWDEHVGVDFIHQIYFNASYNNGATWFAQAINIDTEQQIYGANQPVVACSGNNVSATWLTARGQTGPWEISFSRSTNGGATWLANQLTLATSSVIMDRPDIAQAGNYVYVVWAQAAGTGSEIWSCRSTDYGATWTSPQRLDSGAAGTIRYAAKVVADGTYAHVVWDDKRVNSIENPYVRSTSNAGATWFPEQRINTGFAAGMSRDDCPQLACSGAFVYAVYTSDRLGLNTVCDIYFNVSSDGGVSWMPVDIPISHGGPISSGVGTSREVYPRISVYDYGTDEYVYATWQSNRNDLAGVGNWDIYATYSNNWGQNWMAYDHRIDVGAQPGMAHAELPHIASDWTGPYYVWLDNRNGQTDVYANQYRTGPDEADIQFIESLDGGITWSAPLRVNDDPGTNDQSHPWIDIKPNGVIDVCWYDKRNCPTDVLPEVFRAVMLPGTGAFQANQVVSNQQVPVPATLFGMGDYTGLDVDALDAHVVWTDGRFVTDGQQGDAYYDSFVNPVPPAQKACCFPGGSCLVMNASACAAAGGDFLEDYDTCDPNPCPYDEPRVCCFGEDCTLVLSEMDCLAAGGDFHGDLLTCADNPCATRYPHADHNIGNCTLTITEQGILGFMDHTQTEGSGFIYPQDGLNQLFIGGPWGSSDPTYVANRDYDTDPEREWVVSTDPDGRVWVEDDVFAHQDIHAIFTDEGAAASMGLAVRQTSWAWSSPQVADDFVIVQYQITNTGPAPIEDFYYGLFLDFDMGEDGLDDEGAVDAGRNLVYMKDTSGLHLGLTVIEQSRSVPVANLALVYNPDMVWPNQYVLDSDKYAFLTATDSAHTISESFEENDYGVVASAGPMTIGSGESETVTFAVIGAGSLEELEQNALVAQMIMDYGWADADPGADDSFGTVKVTQLLPCRPNPFQDQTTLFFDLGQSGEVSLQVFDVNGRQVRNLLDGWQNAGRHPVAWQGEDNAGRKLGQGVYYLRLVTRDTTDSKQIVLMR